MPREVVLTVPTPVGKLLLHARGDRLAGITFVAAGEALCTEAAEPDGAAQPLLQQAAVQLEEYFAGLRREFRLPLDLSGLPPFTRRVFETLQRVPYGETLTYGELAKRVGSPLAARAVGQAMAANPLPIVIPCHRVVAAGGRPGGYSGGDGLRTKEWLLALERSADSGN